MRNAEDDPNHWLERAKDARQIAKRLTDIDMQNILEDIAKGYERIADHVTRNLGDTSQGSR
jgi:hypothetical protein